MKLEVKELANKFVDEFKDDRVELGKIVSWLGDVYKRDELAAILGDSVKYRESGKNSLDDELEKVPIRLDSGLMKPETYSDDRITSLVYVLNTYDNYIDTFESIELNDDSNCLDRNKYLISHDLHNILINGYKMKRDRTIEKQDGGVYIVVFKKVKDNLIYKYIKYPYIFYDCLYSYIERESSSLVVTNDNSVGVDYLFVLENLFYSEEEVIHKIKSLSDLFKHKSLYGNSRGIFPRNIVDMFKMLLQGCPIFLRTELLCKFIKLVSERKVYEVVVEIVRLYKFYTNELEGLYVLREKLKTPKLDNYNFIGRVVFITEDLNSLIKRLEVIFYGKVNQGIQK